MMILVSMRKKIIKSFCFVLTVLFVSVGTYITDTIPINPAFASPVAPSVKTRQKTTKELDEIFSNPSTSVEEVIRLIEDGVDVKQNINNYTALSLAAMYNSNPEVLRVLIKNGADVNAADYGGWTPLMHASGRNKNSEVHKVLIEYGANVNAVSRYGNTAVSCAIYNSNPNVLEVLLENGAKANVTDQNACTLLLAAVRNSILKVFQDLIENRADINVSDVYENTPLILLVKHIALVLSVGPSIFIEYVKSRIMSNLLSCDSGVGFSGIILLPLFLAQRWKLSDWFRKKKR